MARAGLRPERSDAIVRALLEPVSPPRLVVAATSARMMAQSVRRGGIRPIALDLFGDTDTRRAGRWIGIGNARRAGIDAARLHAVLTRLGATPGVLGWVAGGGFESRLGLLRDCACALPLIGNDARTVAAIKQPADFFALLDRCGIEHPETRVTMPASNAGWLRKRVGATGGWHVRRMRAILPARAVLPAGPEVAPAARAGAAGAAPSPLYYQREAGGEPMSVLFLGNGAAFSIIGFNRLLVAPVGNRPYVFQGAVGPVAVSTGATRAAAHALGQIVGHFGLVGLNSMDFLLDGDRVSVLEVNPRPSSTIDLHDARFRSGLMAAHVAACRDRTLPQNGPQPGLPVNGFRIVYADRPALQSPAMQARLQELGWCHDIGRSGVYTGQGEPLCTVSAQAASTTAVIDRLQERERAIQQLLEN